jgi:quinol monooxygenase YgiN
MQVGIEVLSKISSENRRMNRFLWVEHWHNKNAMEEYLQSDRFKTIMGAIETLGELIHFNRIEVKNIQQ